MSDALSGQADGAIPSLRDEDLPPLFHDADKRAIKAQGRFFAWLQWELVLLGLGVLIGALNGVADHIGPLPLVVPPFTVAGVRIATLSAFEITEAALLTIALVVRLIRVIARPERLWYEARAVAESVKSIAWRYAVGGEPFQEANTPDELRAIVDDRLNGIRADLSKYQPSDAVAQEHQVTPAMRAIRELPLEQRKRVYRADRVENQQTWYAKKARFNRRRALQAHIILIAVEVFAIIAALIPVALTALHLFPLNLQSLMANIAGGGAAWMQAKRYEDLNAGYQVTASELRQVAKGIEQQHTESAWAHFIENAEGSMSREHQLWRATRVDAPTDDDEAPNPQYAPEHAG
ncbi:MAG TPA: DUF4231 domain-containing protein [Ktedonobacterales bacterium]